MRWKRSRAQPPLVALVDGGVRPNSAMKRLQRRVIAKTCVGPLHALLEGMNTIRSAGLVSTLFLLFGCAAETGEVPEEDVATESSDAISVPCLKIIRKKYDSEFCGQTTFVVKSSCSTAYYARVDVKEGPDTACYLVKPKEEVYFQTECGFFQSWSIKEARGMVTCPR